MIEPLLNAILDDDANRARKIIVSDPTIISDQVETAKFYDEKIFHWLYPGDTPLHLAAAGYRTKIVSLLLESGSSPNAFGNHRRSGPLHYAADGFLTHPNWDGKRQVATLEILLRRGARIDAQDKNGATALHRAVRTRCAAAVRFLLESGCDPLIRNKSGSSAFHLAVQNTGRGGSGEEIARQAQREIIEEFMRVGISPLVKDGKGKGVFEAATSSWIREILRSIAPR